MKIHTHTPPIESKILKIVSLSYHISCITASVLPRLRVRLDESDVEDSKNMESRAHKDFSNKWWAYQIWQLHTVGEIGITSTGKIFNKL